MFVELWVPENLESFVLAFLFNTIIITMTMGFVKISRDVEVQQDLDIVAIAQAKAQGVVVATAKFHCDIFYDVASKILVITGERVRASARLSDLLWLWETRPRPHDLPGSLVDYNAVFSMTACPRDRMLDHRQSRVTEVACGLSGAHGLVGQASFGCGDDPFLTYDEFTVELQQVNNTTLGDLLARVLAVHLQQQQ